MAKIVALTLLVVLVQCFNAELVFRKPVPAWYKQQFAANLKETNGVHYSHTTAEYDGAGYDIPEDNGGNFGDLVHKRRVTDDTLVVRDILINEDVFQQDMEFLYDNRVEGQNITTIRAVNLGRERAWVQLVTSSDRGLVQVQGYIRKNQQVRLLIEAYGVPV